MVGLTWAPIPELIEASWIYQLKVFGDMRRLPEEKELLINASAPLVRDQLIADSIHRGFVGFLMDVIAFWRGISGPLNRPAYSIGCSPNTDYSSLAAMELRSLASKRSDLRWLTGEVNALQFDMSTTHQVSLASLVKGAWDAVEWKRSWVPYVPNDFTVDLPFKLTTAHFVVRRSIILRRPPVQCRWEPGI